MAPTAARETLRPAGPGDAERVLGLLAAAGLPTAGVREALDRFVVAEEAGRIVGVGGLEVHGADGVLRSVAVAPDRRGRGTGARLTDAVVAAARREGLRRLYLLTTTAEGYFPRWGFRRIDREEASEDARRSIEFREACPASATVMVLDLEEGGGRG